MKLICSSFLSLLFGGALISSASAQITTDGSTNTTLTPTDNGIRIDEGSRAGGNLFHSFGEFSVPTGSEAFFNNASDIVNIFSRVTGGNISNIDGLIRANGGANLFLINPAGILFGNNASLQIGGSFYGSTADSILFPDGIEFSATNTQRPLLTINAPIGLNLRDNPEPIVNRSFVQNNAGDFVGLEVAPGETLSLVGGNINFEAGEATASGGRIELGGLRNAGTVTLNDDGSLTFPLDVARTDITLSNAAGISVTGTGGGSITINGRNVSLSAGDFGSSVIIAGITADSTSAEAQAGDITINATEITVDQSFIVNDVVSGGVGNAGRVNIDTTNLTLTNGAFIGSSTLGEGNAGIVSIDTTNLTLTNGGQIDSSTLGEGNAGIVSIDTTNLTLTNRGFIGSNTFGEGDAGTVTINATDSISVDDNSFIAVLVGTGAVGNAGELRIDTTNLTLTNGGFITSSSFGQEDAGTITINAGETISVDNSFILSDVNLEEIGNAGNIRINTTNLNLTNEGQISSITSGEGNAGTVTINATDTISVDNNSLIASQVNLGAIGNAGRVDIETTNLNLTNGGQISTSNSREGNASSISIKATDSISLDGNNSLITSSVNSDAIGNGGVVNIETNNLNLTNGGQIISSTFGEGDAGTVTINATDTIFLDGNLSLISSSVNSDAIGNGGVVNIETNNLNLTNGGQIISSTFGEGDAGTVTINATDTIFLDGNLSLISSSVNPEAVGNAGEVNIDTTNLNLTNQGQISSSTFGEGKAGTVTINATELISVDGNLSQIASSVEQNAVGNGGVVNIETTNLNLTNGGQISSSTSGEGNAGNVIINSTELISLDGNNSLITSSVNSDAIGNGGVVNIETNNLNLTNGGQIISSTFGEGKAGTVTINATELISVDGNNSLITSSIEPNAVGNGGVVNIETTNLTLTNGGQINSSIFGEGNPGTVIINASDTIFLDGNNSLITSQVNPKAIGNAGGVSIETNNLTLTNGGQISSSTFGEGNAGTVTINASELISVDNSLIFSSVQPEAIGNGGVVNIETTNLNLTNRGQISSTTFSQGNAGTVTINASDTISVDGNNSLITSQVNPGAIGNPGGVSIETNNLTLTNGGQISSTTFSQGNAGTVTINASDTISVDGNNSLITSQVSPGAIGNAGVVSIETNNLTLTNGGQISSSTFGEGNASSITIKATDSIELDGSTATRRSGFLATATEGSGEGGDITVITDELNIRNGATISASNFPSRGLASPGTGEPGNINIEANSLYLSNEARIVAATQAETGDTANINVQIADEIVLRDNSFISARAFNNADGGNLTIDSNFLVAFPSNSDGNDIIASAQQGDGGNINITAEALLGIEERPATPGNGTNDIDASSEFGLDGNVTFNVPDTNKFQETVILPDQPLNAQISTLCNPGTSKFIVVGRGGITPNSLETLHINPIPPDWVELPQKHNNYSKPSSSSFSVPNPTPQIVEATGWLINENGKVELVADVNNVAGYDPWQEQRKCTNN